MELQALQNSFNGRKPGEGTEAERDTVVREQQHREMTTVLSQLKGELRVNQQTTEALSAQTKQLSVQLRMFNSGLKTTAFTIALLFAGAQLYQNKRSIFSWLRFFYYQRLARLE